MARGVECARWLGNGSALPTPENGEVCVPTGEVGCQCCRKGAGGIGGQIGRCLPLLTRRLKIPAGFAHFVLHAVQGLSEVVLSRRTLSWQAAEGWVGEENVERFCWVE